MTKQIIVMRKDLNMRKGKIAAQASHACVSVIMKVMGSAKHGFVNLYLNSNNHWIYDSKKEIYKTWLEDWFNNSFTKICVYVNSEKELFEVAQKLKEKGIIFSLIQDNGTTEFHGEKTYTCLATEPRPSEDFDGITSDLPLF